MRLELNLDFEERFAPDRFFFGVAYAPYCEGGGLNAPDGFKNTDWTRKQTGRRDLMDEGLGFWTNYAEHVELAASLGLNAFRMGIEWARCQPSASTEPTDPPPWDEAALDHYADMVELVIDRGMQPIITLHHFTHPLWLGVDIWLEDRGPDLLIDAQVRIVDEINARLMARGSKKMAHFLVYNEPTLIPLFYHSMDWYPGDGKGPEYLPLAFDTMLSHYVRAYDGIHDPVREAGLGNIHRRVHDREPVSVRVRQAARRPATAPELGVAREDAAAKIAGCRSAWRARVDDLARSQLTDEQVDRYLDTVEATADSLRPERFTKTLDALYASPRPKKLDYLSLNVYEPFDGPRRDPADTERRIKWERYTMDGEIYRTFILATNDGNTDLPVYMGENSSANLQADGRAGAATPRRLDARALLKTYLMEMVRCMKEGVPIEGYLYWTLVDNVQPPRLGLYNYDFANHQILDTDGFGQPSAGSTGTWSRPFAAATRPRSATRSWTPMQSSSEESEMETRRLGRIGHMSSVLLFGGAALSEVSEEDADRSIQQALDAGINHFDTAAGYGDSELHLGRWMPEIRDRIFLATKTSDRAAADAYDSIRRSLERLRVDAVDLIQLHAIGDLDDLGAATGSGGAVEGASRARDEGLVGAIGITGHGMRAPAVHLEALRRFPFDTVITPFNYRLAREPEYLRDFDALAAQTRAQDVGLMAIKVAARNLWRREKKHRYTTWYEPLDTQEHVDATVAFALARPEITGICTAGDVRLLPMFVEAERRRSSISVAQAEAAMAGVAELEPPFVRVPGREVPEWLEPLML